MRLCVWCVHACACRGQKTFSGAVPQEPSASLFRQGLLLRLNSLRKLGWVAAESQGLTCLHLPIGCPGTPVFSPGILGNPGPQACKASTFLSELSPRPIVRYFSKRDFAANTLTPTLAGAPNKRKQAQTDSSIHLRYPWPSREMCLLTRLFP